MCWTTVEMQFITEAGWRRLMRCADKDHMRDDKSMGINSKIRISLHRLLYLIRFNAEINEKPRKFSIFPWNLKDNMVFTNFSLEAKQSQFNQNAKLEIIIV